MAKRLPNNKHSILEEQLVVHMRACKVRVPAREYKFAEDVVGGGPGVRVRFKQSDLKNWRFDFAWPDRKFAVEVEGGGGTGRHTTAKGFREDMEKYHHAMDLGWTIYRCDRSLINSGKAVGLIMKIVGGSD